MEASLYCHGARPINGAWTGRRPVGELLCGLGTWTANSARSSPLDGSGLRPHGLPGIFPSRRLKRGLASGSAGPQHDETSTASHVFALINLAKNLRTTRDPEVVPSPCSVRPVATLSSF